MGHLLDDSLSNSHRKTGYTCKKGEEIYTYYGGDSYWGDGRTHTNVI